MKRFLKYISLVLSFLMIISLLFVSCNKTNEEDEQTNETETTEAATTEEFIDISPYPVEETFMPSEVFEHISSSYAGKRGFSALPLHNAPYISSAITNITNCTLKSISIPVFRTGAADENGDLHFTLGVYNSSFKGIKSEPIRSYVIKVNAEKNGISPLKGNIYKFVEVDLSSYDIALGADETLGFFSKNDTLIPAFIQNNSDNANEPLKYLRSEFPRANGCYIKGGSNLLEYSADTLVFDLEWERVYESLSVYNKESEKAKADEYASMVEALKEKYEGKYVSVIGDSISTYGGICNDKSSNLTIGDNAVYYSGVNHNLFGEENTYWGKLIKDLGMKRCVINTWSGSKVYGATSGSGNMVERSVQLHRDGGTASKTSDDIAPDVILIYFGINDLNGGTMFGDLFIKLRKADESEKNAIVDEWFKPVKKNADSINGVVQGKSYKSYEQAYALGIYAMKEKYPNAEIFCMTLQESNHDNTTETKLNNFNVSIRAIANYFGATVVDQATDGITWDNCHAYGCDIRALHPNVPGHAKMTENIVRTMYEKINAD